LSVQLGEFTEIFLALIFSPIYVRVCTAGYKSDCD